MDNHNTTIAYQITWKYLESEDEEETFTVADFGTWIFFDKEKMMNFLKRLIKKERERMKRSEEEEEFQYSEHRSGARNLSWYGELRGKEGHCECVNVDVDRVEVDAEYNEEDPFSRMCQPL